MNLRVECLCIDTRDPRAIAPFWEQALGWRRTSETEHEIEVAPPESNPADGAVPYLLFLKVPEEKSVKNRLHLDLRPADQEAEVERLIGLGARRVSVGQTPEMPWVVLADPDGNEFCVLRAKQQ